MECEPNIPCIDQKISSCLKHSLDMLEACGWSASYWYRPLLPVKPAKASTLLRHKQQRYRYSYCLPIARRHRESHSDILTKSRLLRPGKDVIKLSTAYSENSILITTVTNCIFWELRVKSSRCFWQESNATPNLFLSAELYTAQN